MRVPAIFGRVDDPNGGLKALFAVDPGLVELYPDYYAYARSEAEIAAEAAPFAGVSGPIVVVVRRRGVGVDVSYPMREAVTETGKAPIVVEVVVGDRSPRVGEAAARLLAESAVERGVDRRLAEGAAWYVVRETLDRLRRGRGVDEIDGRLYVERGGTALSIQSAVYSRLVDVATDYDRRGAAALASTVLRGGYNDIYQFLTQVNSMYPMDATEERTLYVRTGAAGVAVDA